MRFRTRGFLISAILSILAVRALLHHRPQLRHRFQGRHADRGAATQRHRRHRRSARKLDGARSRRRPGPGIRRADDAQIRIAEQPGGEAAQQDGSRARSRARSATELRLSPRRGRRAARVGSELAQRHARRAAGDRRHPGLHLVPLRMAIRARRLIADYHDVILTSASMSMTADRLRPDLGRGDPDHPRLLAERYGRHLSIASARSCAAPSACRSRTSLDYSVIYICFDSYVLLALRDTPPLLRCDWRRPGCFWSSDG